MKLARGPVRQRAMADLRGPALPLAAGWDLGPLPFTPLRSRGRDVAPAWAV
jgi:hypothetical protein